MYISLNKSLGTLVRVIESHALYINGQQVKRQGILYMFQTTYHFHYRGMLIGSAYVSFAL